jgi:hypothetical protein
MTTNSSCYNSLFRGGRPKGSKHNLKFQNATWPQAPSQQIFHYDAFKQNHEKMAFTTKDIQNRNGIACLVLIYKIYER